MDHYPLGQATADEEVARRVCSTPKAEPDTNRLNFIFGASGRRVRTANAQRAQAREAGTRSRDELFTV